MTITIYHNPRCSKSRAALQYLEDTKVEFDIVTYLDGSLNAQKLSNILSALGMSASEVIRKGEKIYKALNLKDEQDEQKLINAIAKHPILLERPILVKGDQAAIARPIENIFALIKN